MSEILSHMKHLTLQGNQAKQVKYISQYCFRQLLINIDIVDEVDLGDLIKTLSITENTIFLRNVDVLPSKVALINSTLVHALGKHALISSDSH